MNNLLYAGAYVVAEKLGKMKKNKSNEKQKKTLVEEENSSKY